MEDFRYISSFDEENCLLLQSNTDDPAFNVNIKRKKYEFNDQFFQNNKKKPNKWLHRHKDVDLDLTNQLCVFTNIGPLEGKLLRPFLWDIDC